MLLSKNIQKIVFPVVCACATLLFTACGGRTNSFTWFVEAIPSNLDPQIAVNAEDIMACTNLYGTLLREDENGTLQPDLAESYTISDDGLTYTFTLKEGLVYHSRSAVNEDYALTADDFVFAFTRIFSPETASPYTDLYANLKNATAVHNGDLRTSALGVSAPDARTVVFTLTTPDEAFLEALALPAAAPCDQDFFESTNGTYGLTTTNTLSSGAFYLYNWTTTGLFLRRSVEMDSGLVDNLRLIENSDETGMSAEASILEERCTAMTDIGGDATTLKSLSYSDTTWGLLYNQDGVLANQDLRAALAAVATTIDLTECATFDPAITGLVPNGMEIDGLDYREVAGNTLTTLPPAKESFSAALETLSISELGTITLLVPEGYPLDSYVNAINSAWQKELSLYFSVEVVDKETFDTRLSSGAYTIALAPITATQNDLVFFLGHLNAPYGLSYQDSTYDMLLQLASESNGSKKCDLIKQAEHLLLEQIVVTPLFSQQKRLLMDAAVSHLVFDPFGPVLDLTYTTK